MKKSFLMMLAALLLASCGDGRPSVDLFPERDGCISYVCDAPFEGDTVWLHYHVPAEGDIASLPVQIVIPGMLRDGERYRNDWIAKADEYGFVVLVPQMEDRFFPERIYQQGGIVREDGSFSDPEERVYPLIDQLFCFFKEHSGSRAKGYNLYGHSAGGQFVHRFALFHDSPYVQRMVAANAGWYTFPDETVDFPYGIAEIGARDGIDPARFYGKELTILLGEADTLRSSSLRKTPEADAQGMNRLERGRKFFTWCQEDASRRGADFRFQLRTVSGSGHSDSAMAPKAADILYGETAPTDFRRTGRQFTFYRPANRFASLPVKVCYYLPENYDAHSLRVLMILHGGHRQVETALDSWERVADAENLLLLGPDFDAADYPNLIFLTGGIRDEGNFVPVGESLYPIYDALFETARKQLKFKTEEYDVFGHSAGGQTAHRLRLFDRSPRVNRVVAANSGWYTFPDDSTAFPYGIADYDGPLDLDGYLADSMTILVGEADTLVNFGLRMNAFTRKQGPNRYARGLAFYQFARDLAARRGVPFGWEVQVVEHAGHDEDACSKAAARLLYGVEIPE